MSVVYIGNYNIWYCTWEFHSVLRQYKVYNASSQAAEVLMNIIVWLEQDFWESQNMQALNLNYYNYFLYLWISTVVAI
jgi:hypothetical protein